MVRRFHLLGWTGPFPGGKHPTMRREGHSVTIPNPHQGDIDWSLMKRVLQEANIEADEWNDLG